MDQLMTRMCGLDLSQAKPPEPLWLDVTLNILGAERYVLGTRRSAVSLTSNPAGFRLEFKEEVMLVADQLLGRRIHRGLITDVMMVFDCPMPDMSLAMLMPGRYPIVLRRGERVYVN